MDLLEDETSMAYKRQQEILNYKHATEGIDNRVKNASFQDSKSIMPEVNSMYEQGYLQGQIIPGKTYVTSPDSVSGDLKTTELVPSLSTRK